MSFSSIDLVYADGPVGSPNNPPKADIRDTLNQLINKPAVGKSANYTAVATDAGKVLVFSASATLSLTAAATLGSKWWCYVRAQGGAVTIDPNGSETVDGATALILPQGAAALLICTGTVFYTVGIGGSSGLAVPGKSGASIEIIGGAIRQDPTDRTKWNFIDDSLHDPIGISGTYAVASSGNITINYGKTYSKVLAFSAGPDETLANTLGVHVGASVGLSSAVINCGSHFQGAATINYDGSGTWNITPGANQDIGITFNAYTGAGGYAVFDHNYCRGIDITVQPDTVGATISNPYIPVLRSAGNTSFQVAFMDPTTGSLVTGAASTRMAFRVSKRNNGGLYLDGTNGSDTLGLDAGNIWFFGVFQV